MARACRRTCQWSLPVNAVNAAGTKTAMSYLCRLRLLRSYTYPDVMVIAGEPIYWENRTDTITNPIVIIEVLSESTAGYDREGKFQAYRTIPSFGEYVLIDQTRIYIEQYSKTAKKRWSLCEYDEEDENITLISIPFQFSLANVYNKVKFADTQKN
ncbi:MAG: Uma2 family endonuclease [Microcoleus sp. SIO2G3]|nr:Uma2 family endonuclease [Microcoleus sp. SIO2G3]